MVSDDFPPLCVLKCSTTHMKISSMFTMMWMMMMTTVTTYFPALPFGSFNTGAFLPQAYNILSPLPLHTPDPISPQFLKQKQLTCK